MFRVSFYKGFLTGRRQSCDHEAHTAIKSPGLWRYQDHGIPMEKQNKWEGIRGAQEIDFAVLNQQGPKNMAVTLFQLYI